MTLTAPSAAVNIAVGEAIPPATPHAVSVSLPTWRANVGYEEGEAWVISKMQTGYPRFFINKYITAFVDSIVEIYGHSDEQAMLFPSHPAASRCIAFIQRQVPQLSLDQLRILDLVPDPRMKRLDDVRRVSPAVSAVFFPRLQFPVAKQFWQHSGEGISSRRAEYCHTLFEESLLIDKDSACDLERTCKGPRRYQKVASVDKPTISPTRVATDESGGDPQRKPETSERDKFIEERFGRNLDLSLAESAKSATRKRIAGCISANCARAGSLPSQPILSFSEEDVYLYPGGMNAIYNAHRMLLKMRGELKSINFGFPYIDTLKVLEKFGPGALFYGFGESHELEDLQRRLERGEKFLALFCEFPGNPLLKTPDLQMIRRLADDYDFAVVVDETIGNFLNVHVLPYADIVVSSLTKLFSGDSNVMGGSAILNPSSRYYKQLKAVWTEEFEDNFWPEDAIFLERNSRDFIARNERTNHNAAAVCDVLRVHPKVKQVNYPKYGATKSLYEKCRTPTGGYGGLLSATFHSKEDAIAFYDHLDTAKGPSLGTNFTLSSPFVILAHYNELAWAASYGAESTLVRFSIGLEDTGELVALFRRALAATVKESRSPGGG